MTWTTEIPLDAFIGIPLQAAQCWRSCGPPVSLSTLAEIEIPARRDRRSKSHRIPEVPDTAWPDSSPLRTVRLPFCPRLVDHHECHSISAEFRCFLKTVVGALMRCFQLLPLDRKGFGRKPRQIQRDPGA